MKKLFLVVVVILFILSGCEIGVNIVEYGDEEMNLNNGYKIIKTDNEEKVTLNIVDWSDSTKKSREKLNDRFMKDHPNVTINYTTLTQSQFNETMLSGIRSGNAPDLFPLPSTVFFSTAINEGWFIPLNIYLDSNFFSSLKDNVFKENITTKKGYIYLLPEAEAMPSTLIFYNKKVLNEAGISLNELPTTWEEYLSITKLVSERGEGKYFGIVTSGAQKNRIDLELRSFSEISGARLGPAEQVFLNQGKNQFNSSQVIDALDFYNKLYENGCFHPDSASLSAPEARSIFAENKAAFIVQGSWCIPIWKENNPDLDFGVIKIPDKEKFQKYKMIRPFTKGWMGISSSSKHPDIAAEYLKYLYSYEYQSELVKKGGFVSIRNDLGEEDIEDKVMRNYYQLSMEQSIQGVNPIEKNEYLELVYLNSPQLIPDFGDISAGILSGEKNYKEKMNDYSKRLQEKLNKSIDIVKKKYPVKIYDFNYSE
ncbi:MULTISPECIES: ABC transporter substrate-binding protein [Clostridium]|uniref:Putative bacterial extracellular solute-binding protein n=1 Tax=Clostridium butyricum E4 str. BoNT E BL5262 TaxID=632245 RepID=C4IH81_CLOBU|nr:MULTISPECIES: extracellular solute-binding protein [Clostridium]APF24292.1 bacterial extracellular solute-binding family protein [Clostridium butyricum]EDT75044.1 putative bacterial extracellular solute-binding protein [Clostridium butyricum 5521]EEP54894.1 putative bacterial extracellular solute-binding protein [Clostridium butyricum E4 str. BoNT E BL5262]MDU2895416.1 extracellular solute-binding protein [Clostridium sp.]MDU3007572.1 extracellular solute-binding protein [Clostridium sp.]